MAGLPQTRIPDAQLFRDVFNASPIGIVVENMEGQPLFVNPAFCSMLGFSENELFKKHCVDFSPAEDAEKDWALFQQLRAGSIDRYQMEKRYFRRDGSLIWGNLSISLLNIVPPLIVAMVEDITERKAAEEARFKHTAIVESSEDAIISKNLDGVIVSWNEGAERIFGYTEAEAIGQPIAIIIPPDLYDKEDGILERLKAGGRIEHLETVRVTKAGQKVDVSLNLSSVKDSTGRIVGFTKIARDITGRKRTEKMLLETNRALEKETAEAQAREELLKVFVKNVPAAVAMLDREMRYLQVSDRWCTDYLPGYLSGKEQAVGRSHYEIFPDMPERWKEIHLRALAGETLRADEDHWVGQDGPHWARWEVRPWKTPERTVGGILIFAEDISQRKKMEQSLVDMSRKLIESEERERARIGRELHDDIGQRLTMLMLELDQLSSDPSELQGRIRELLGQAAEISHDVQALSHELHSSKLAYLGVVAGIRSWCREFAKRQRLEVDFKDEVHSAIPFEVGLCLFRILQEALHNAVKHSGAKRIEVELAERQNEVHLNVRDSGKGFDIEAATRDTGLGLTSMQERVRLLSGKIEILSKPMGGTTIHVRLPLEPAHSPELAAG